MATTIPTAHTGLLEQLHRWIRWARWSAYGLSVLFVAVVIAEAARVFQTAYGVYPTLGYASLIVMVGLAGLVIWPIYRFVQVPRVIHPPKLPAAGEAKLGQLRAELRYLERYLAASARNAELADKTAEILAARDGLGEIARRLRHASDADAAALGQTLGAWADEHVTKILADVDAKAEKLIYEEALAVGVGTAASPNGTLDAFVMLWRSVHLTSRLAVLYYGRPGLWGTLSICRDVSLATATAAYLQSVTDSLGAVVAKTLGGIGGIVAGPAVEGITNALVVVRIGYLAKERCRSFQKWDTAARRSALVNALDATQKVALGLSGEILRKVGTGLGVIMDAAAAGVTQAASATAETVASVAKSARDFATDLGEKVGLFRARKPEEEERR